MIQHTSGLYAFAFDLDGTLSDSIPDLAMAANAMRQHFHLTPLEAQRIQTLVGDGIGILVHRALTNDHEGQVSHELWEKGYRFFIEFYQAHIADLSKLYPGVKDGLALLRTAQKPLVLISNKPEKLCLKLLTALGIRDSFCLVLGGDTLPEKKPSPLPLIHTCEVLDIEPQHLGMVGDSQNDISAAHAAGAYAIAVNYGYQQADELKADLVINSIVNLYNLVSNA